jgi:sulfate/thiosulfate transport system substrate-binding protein
MRTWARVLFYAGLAMLGAGALGCGRAQDPNVDELTIGAYSVVQEVFRNGLIPAFEAEWQKKTGRSVRFEGSYIASGAQARSIVSGFPADVSILSHEGDMDSLVKAGCVKSSWRDGPDRGMVTNSLVVIGHRAGNPKGIKDWADLATKGVQVLYPDPKTSGGARWNINAIYGSAFLASRDANQGKADLQAVHGFLKDVQANVVNMDGSGRQSMANFAERGTGDAVVTYENEILLHNKGKQGGEVIPYVTPPATLLIESPAAVVETSVESHGNRAVALAFIEFLHSEQGQRIFAEFGFRPVKAGVAAPEGAGGSPPKLFTMADLGGWAKVEGELYGPKGLWTTIFTAEASSRALGR